MKKIKSPPGWWSGKSITRSFQIVSSGLLLSLAGDSLASAADGVEFFAVTKFDHYLQSSEQAPQLVQDPFRMGFSVEGMSSISVSAVKVVRPGGSVFELERERTSDFDWEKDYKFSSRIDRDTHFPGGDYVFTITTANDGDQMVTLGLTGNDFPAAPWVSNYAAAQEIDSTTSFLLEWDTFAGAGTDDFLVIRIENAWNNYERVYESDFLPATTSSLNISAGMLEPGEVYDVWITSVKMTDKDETTFENGKGLAVHGSNTELQIQTVSNLAPGADVNEFRVAKIKSYTQDSALPPQEMAEADEVFIETRYGDTVRHAEVMFPNGATHWMRRGEVGDHAWTLSLGSTTWVGDWWGWDGFLPSGTYRFYIQTEDGRRVALLKLTEENHPAAPRISNYEATQEIDPTAPFVLEWDVFVGAGPGDLIEVGIKDAWGGGEVYKSGFLPATSSFWEISAETFQPGRAYKSWVTFMKVTDKNDADFEDGTGLAVYASETSLQIQTVSDLGPGNGVENYAVMNTRAYSQHDAVPRPINESLGFGAYLLTKEVDTVLSAAIMLPDGELYWAAPDWNDRASWYFKLYPRLYPNSNLLPNGIYRFLIETADGVRVVPLKLAEENYPPVPRISNIEAIRSIDSTESFTLTWDAFPEATEEDIVIFSIDNRLAIYENDFEAVFLPSNTTSIEILAGSLKPGRTYGANVTFVKVTDRNDTAFIGSLGFAGYASGTSVFLQTLSNPGPGEGVEMYGVVKLAFFHQSDSETPQFNAGCPFELLAFVNATGGERVRSAALTLPNGKTESLGGKGWPHLFWDRSESFSSQETMDAEFPDGTYTFNISGEEEGKFVSLHLGGNAYPSPLRVNNFEAAQSINASKGFTLNWDPPVGVGENDFIVVEIGSSNPNQNILESGYLPPHINSLEIPHGILEDGQNYEVRLTLVHVVDEDTVSFNGGRGVSGYGTETRFRFKTLSGYELWADQLPPGERGEMDDAGGHGIVNYLRYAFGMDPLQPSREDLPQLGIQPFTEDLSPRKIVPSTGPLPPILPGERLLDWQENTNYLTLRHFRRKGANDYYWVDYSRDLVEWKRLSFWGEIVDSQGDRDSVTIIDPVPIEDHDSRFLRVRVVRYYVPFHGIPPLEFCRRTTFFSLKVVGGDGDDG